MRQAEAYEQAGKYQKAIDKVNIVVKEQPRYAEAFYCRGFLAPLTDGDSALRKGRDLVTAITLAALLLQWCEYDRREHEIMRWRYFGVMMILCPGPLILMPIYFLATRGARGLVSILKASVLFALAIVAMLTGFAVSAAIFGGWKHLLG